MSKRTVTAFFLLLAALFLLANRGAYKGYFSDDEIDNLSWTPFVSAADFAQAAATPLFIKDNFRPVGHLYFKLMERCCGLDFPAYVGVVHLLHFLNLWLLWVLVRKLGARPLQAAAAVCFFGLHMALFDALWKPMYVFDVLCATLSLTSLIAWIDRRWILSFAAFWLAYKSKELAVMLPAVILVYEWTLGGKRWKPLLPFFAASLSFGLQGILLNPNRDNDYTFRFTFAALAKTSLFYAGRLLLIPYAGFAALAALLLVRNRRAWFGLALAGLLFLPLLFLPGRLFSAYCYLPFTGIAVAVSAIDLESRRARFAMAAFFALWLPWNYQQMRIQRRAKLAKDDETRAWVTALGKFAAASPHTDAFVFAGAPTGFQRWGIEGAIKYFYKRGDLKIAWVDDPKSEAVAHTPQFAMLTWEAGPRRLTIAAHTPETADVPYLKMGPSTPVWQLGDGWFALEDTYRWTRPHCTARLWRPANARRFALRVNLGPEQMQKVSSPQVTVAIAGQSLPPRRFPEFGWRVEQWDLPPAPPGAVDVTFDVSPAFRPNAQAPLLGLAIGAFGFVEDTQK